MIEYQFERFNSFYADSAHLMLEHDEEVGSWEMKYQLDLPRYRALEANGRLYILTARENDRMVGYIMFVMMRHPHYPVMIAWEDAHFLTKEARKGLRNPWFKMVEICKDLAKSIGARAFVMHEKEAKPLGRLFSRLGFSRSDSLWMVRF